MERSYLMHEEEEEYDRGGILERIKSMFGRGEEYEDEDDMDQTPTQRPTSHQRPALRLDPARPHAIFVRKDVRSMNDAQAAADRLKERRPVILNFERTDDEVAQHAVDFISGVVYALDGFYQKVGDKVFLFTPSNTAIAVEDSDGIASGNSGLYDGR